MAELAEALAAVQEHSFGLFRSVGGPMPEGLCSQIEAGDLHSYLLAELE